MNFKLEIRLGNAAMQTGDDVAQALQSLAHHFTSAYDGLILPEAGGTIRDLNGNRVGEWSVSE